MEDKDRCCGWERRVTMVHNGKLWVVAAILVFVALVITLTVRLLNPHPPDLSGGRYDKVSVSVRGPLREDGSFGPPLRKSSTNPAVIEAMASVVLSGTAAVNCRCVNIVKVTFNRRDGDPVVLHVTPSHGNDDCQIRVENARYRVERQKWIAAVATFGLPDQIWIDGTVEPE